MGKQMFWRIILVYFIGLVMTRNPFAALIVLILTILMIRILMEIVSSVKKCCAAVRSRMDRP